jgi:hypothetical protein
MIHQECIILVLCDVNGSYQGFLWYVMCKMNVTQFSLADRTINYTFNTVLIKYSVIFSCSCINFGGTGRKSSKSHLRWSVNRGNSWNRFSLICYWCWTDGSFVVYPHENGYVFSSIFRNDEHLQFSAAFFAT